jgi:hypothetical protein
VVATGAPGAVEDGGRTIRGAAARANPDTARGSGSGSLPGCAPMW